MGLNQVNEREGGWLSKECEWENLFVEESEGRDVGEGDMHTDYGSHIPHIVLRSITSLFFKIKNVMQILLC